MLTLSPSQQQELRSLQRATQERSVYIRVTAVLMLGEGLSASFIASVLGIDESSVYRYGNAYPKATSLGDFVTRPATVRILPKPPQLWERVHRPGHETSSGMWPSVANTGDPGLPQLPCSPR